VSEPHPGSSAEPIGLPIRFRPLGARMASGTAGAVLSFMLVFLWAMLPPAVKADFSWAERITVLFFFVGVMILLYGVFRTNALADDSGLTFVNGYHAQHFDWAELVRVSLTRNRPWALIDLSDGETVAVMAIATSDGDRATADARRLSTVLAQQTRTDRND
jgi:PH (Pleckstrin Homology) domain-containing protein